MSASTAPTRRITAASLGKIPTTRARRLISLLTRSSGLVDQIFDQWARGNAVNARTSALAWSISGPIFGKDLVSWSRTSSQVAATVVASGWAKMVRNTAATMSVWVLGTRASRLRATWTRQRWCAVPWKDRLRAAMRPACWSEITSRTPPSPRFFRSVRKARQNTSSSLSPTSRPHHDRDLAAAVGGDPGRDHDGHRHDLGGGVADVEVGGVEVDIRERGVVQPPLAEGGEDLVEAGADPGRLRLGEAGVDAQRGDQVVDRAGRHAADVGLHHHRIQGLVDAAAGFEDDREERPLPQLRDPQLDVTGLGGQQPVTCAVTLGHPGTGAFVLRGADQLGRLGFDQLLHDHPNRLADQIDAPPGAECVKELGHGRLGQGHR